MSYKRLSKKFFIRPFSKGFYNSKSMIKNRIFEAIMEVLKQTCPLAPQKPGSWLVGLHSVPGWQRLASTAASPLLHTSQPLHVV